MKPRFSRLHAAFVPFGFAALLGTAAASTNIVFPNDPSVINVKTAHGAVGDGVADDTNALQAAINAGSGGSGAFRIVYLPNGIYRITRTLVCNSAIGPWIYGQSRDGVIIRLSDGAAAQATPPLTSVLRTYFSDDQTTSADHFMRHIRHLTIDAGNNPNVDGIRWFSNNSGLLKDIRVIGNGQNGIFAGFVGQSGPSLVQDATIEGFDTGVRLQWSWGQTLSRVQVRNCRTQGVYVNATAAGIEDLTVENTPVGLNIDFPNDWTWWGGVVALINGRFLGGTPSQTAIVNRSVLYARNIESTGYGTLISSITPGGNVTGPTRDHYLSHPAQKLFEDSPDTSLGLPIKAEPQLTWPSAPSDWVNAHDFGVAHGDAIDDGPALQGAIDAAAQAGKSVVYVRGVGGAEPNWYLINSPVRIHGSVRLVIALGWGRVISSNGQGTIFIDETSAPTTEIRHFQAFGGTPVAVENRSATKTLFIQSCDFKVVGSGQGDIFVTDCPSAVELRRANQSLWARQLNPEGNSNLGLVRNHGAKLWALGVKHEGAGVRVRTDSGGQTELFGVFNYGPGLDPEDPRPAFEIDHASMSIAGIREIHFGGSDFPIKVRERRAAGERRYVGGGWIGWSLYTGYSPATLSAPPQTATPLFEPIPEPFVGSIQVQAVAPGPDSTLRYTLDGTEPSSTSTLWTGPLVFNATQTLRVKAFSAGLNPSATATGLYERLEPRPPETSLTAANGLRYDYYETEPLSAVPDFTNRVPQRTGTVTFVDISPRLRNDNIAMRFTGFYTARQTGVYRFFTTSDDGSKLWIGNQLVVDNDGVHAAQERSGYIALSAGVHPLTVGWFNALGGLFLTASVREPGRSKQDLQGLPLMVLGGEQALANRTHQLEYAYYEGLWNSLPNFAALTPVATGIADRISVAPRRRDDAFALRFSGWLRLPSDGLWRFYTTSDDGSRLFLGNQEIVNNNFVQPPTERSGAVAAKAGFHPFVVEYFENSVGEFLSASYEGPGVPKQEIPATALFRVVPPQEDEDGDGVSNFLAYAMGLTQPGLVPPASLPRSRLVLQSGSTALEFEFFRRTDSPDLDYILETSTTLQETWQSLPISLYLHGSPETMAPGLERVRIRDPRVGPEHPQRFYRMRVRRSGSSAP